MKKPMKDGQGDELTTITQSVTEPQIKIISKGYFTKKSQVHDQFKKKNDRQWVTLFKEISIEIE